MARVGYFPWALLNKVFPQHVVAALNEIATTATEASGGATAAQAAADAAQADADTAQGTADGAQSDADTAQGTADGAVSDAADAQLTADEAATYGIWNPPSIVWSSDGAGVFVGGNPTQSATLTVYSKAAAAIATRVISAQLTSASGIVDATAGAQTGLASTVALVDDNTTSVRADVTVTYASGAKKVFSAGFSSLDVSTAVATPATGGGK